MKKVLLLLTMILTVSVVFSQTGEKKNMQQLPSVDVRTMEGEPFNTSQISNDGKPIILSFWALWCKPCIRELNTISEVYDEWIEETGVKLVAVSIDDTRSSSQVATFVNGQAWDYEVLLDPNSDFKREMNVNLIPHTFLIDGKGNIVWQHTSFSEGAELELIDQVRKVAKGESPDNH